MADHERPHSRYTRERTWAALYSQHINAGYALVPYSKTNNSIAVIRCQSPGEVQTVMRVLLAHAEDCAVFYATEEAALPPAEQRSKAREQRTLPGAQEKAAKEKAAMQALPEEVRPLLARARHAVVLARSSDYYHYHLADLPSFRLVICGVHDSYLQLPVWETRTNQRYAARETAVPLNSPDFDRIRRSQYGHNILLGALVNKDQEAQAFLKRDVPKRTQRRIMAEVTDLQEKRYHGRPMAFLTDAERREIGAKISASLKRYYVQLVPRWYRRKEPPTT